jgi:hypothetical protein
MTGRAYAEAGSGWPPLPPGGVGTGVVVQTRLDEDLEQLLLQQPPATLDFASSLRSIFCIFNFLFKVNDFPRQTNNTNYKFMIYI